MGAARPNPSHAIWVEEHLAGASFITRTLAPHPRRRPMYRTHVPYLHTVPTYRTPTVPAPYPYCTHVPNVPYPCTQCTVPSVPYPCTQCTVPSVPYTCTQKPHAAIACYSRFLGTCVRYIGYVGTVHGYGTGTVRVRYVGTVHWEHRYGTWVQ